MEKLLQGIEQFQTSVFPQYQQTFRQLAHGQRPEAMLITCADSRIQPDLILQSDPGEIFVCRNAGNIVPPYDADTSGVAASVEYAVDVLQIRNLIVCGHSDCGAMKALFNPESVRERPAVRRWLKNADAARRIALQGGGSDAPVDRIRVATEANIIAQLANLATYPCVAAAMATGTMNLYGWYYDIGSGAIFTLTAGSRQFAELDRRVISDEWKAAS